jgi:hypothetical protein
MLRGKHIIAGFFVFSLVNGNVFAAARLEPLTIGYSNFTGTYAPLWIAVEEHIGAKHGLDLKAIYAGCVPHLEVYESGLHRDQQYSARCPWRKCRYYKKYLD